MAQPRRTCSSACAVYEGSGCQDIYRPTYRSQVLRQIYDEYVKGGGGLVLLQSVTFGLVQPPLESK